MSSLTFVANRWDVADASSCEATTTDDEISRRTFISAGAIAGVVMIARDHEPHDLSHGVAPANTTFRPSTLPRVITLDAKPAPVKIDLSKTVLLVVDMQNDFGAEGGLLHRAGIDITGIRGVIAPCAKVRAAAHAAGIKTVYLKMGLFRSSAGPNSLSVSWLPLADHRTLRHIARMGQPKIDFSHLSPEERIQLAEDLWDSLAETPEAVVVPEAHAREIDRRLDAYRRDGDPGRPWPDVLGRIETRLRERGG